MDRISHLGGAAVSAGLILATLGAGTASATVTGGCSATGTAESGTVDLTTATEWHLKTSDTANGTATAPSAQKAAEVRAYAFGIGLPIASGSGDGDTQGSAGPYDVAAYARIARILALSGSSDSCAGSVDVIIDDQSALTTLLGGGGLAAAIIAGLIVLLLAMRSAGGGRRLSGLLLGLVGGVGVGLLLLQLGTLDPRSILGLLAPLIGGIIGLVLPGMFARSSTAG